MSCKVYTVRVYEYKTEWRNEAGQLHREDGPAIEWADGTKSWWVNGQYHRLGGPAYEGDDGSKFWYVDGQYHRLDGPAVERSDGSVAYWIEGEYLTKEEFLARTNPTSCSGKVVEIDGIKYKLTPL